MTVTDYKEPLTNRFQQYPDYGINARVAYVPLGASSDPSEPLVPILHKLVPVLDDEGWYINHQGQIYGKVQLIQQLERELTHEVATLWSMSENALLQLSKRIEKLRRMIFDIESPQSCLERALGFFCYKRSLPEEGPLYKLHAEVSKVARWMHYFKNTKFHQDQIFRDDELPRPVHIVVGKKRTIAFLLFTKTKLNDHLIGAGSFKRVKLALQIGTPHKFVTASVREHISEAQNEADTLDKLSNLNCIVRLISYVDYSSKKKTDDNQAILKGRFLMEYCSERSIDKNLRYQCLTEGERYSLFRQIIEAVATIHKTGLIHCDLSMQNFLLHRKKDGALQLKIGDFGAACTMLDTDKRSSYRTNIWYISPDLALALIDENPEKIRKATTSALDSWSVACCLHWLVYNEAPYWVNAFLYPDSYRSFDHIRLDAQTRTKYLTYPGRYNERAFNSWKGEMALLHYLSSEYQKSRAHKLPLFEEPQEKNTPEHLIWEMFCKRTSVIQAYERLKEIEFPNLE